MGQFLFYPPKTRLTWVKLVVSRIGPPTRMVTHYVKLSNVRLLF